MASLACSACPAKLLYPKCPSQTLLFKEHVMNQPGASLKALAFAVTMATASMANASTTDLGTVAPGSMFSAYVFSQRLGVFEDFYVLMATGVSDAEGKWMSLASDTQNYSYTDLGVGDYNFRVGGEAGMGTAFIDDQRYNEQISISAAAVPEPETYAMLFAGLGIMGTVVRRRSRRF
jgi:hypothetical protein